MPCPHRLSQWTTATWSVAIGTTLEMTSLSYLAGVLPVDLPSAIENTNLDRYEKLCFLLHLVDLQAAVAGNCAVLGYRHLRNLITLQPALAQVFIGWPNGKIASQAIC